DGTRLLTEAAIDALEQIDVVSRRAARSVGGNIRFDRDRKRGTHRFAQLACDATLLSVGIAPLRVQPAIARRLRRLLFRILNRDARAQRELPKRDGEPDEELGQEQCLEEACRRFHLITSSSARSERPYRQCASSLSAPQP